MATDKTVRFCIPVNFGDGLLEPDGSRLKGTLGDKINPFLEMGAKKFNLTTIFKENYENMHLINSSDSYTGCLGELQRGESDFMFLGMNYPVDVVNVSQGFIILDEETSFLGGFVRPSAIRAADFTSSLTTFHWSLYVIIAMFIYMFFILLRVRRAIHLSMIKSLADIRRVNRMGQITYRRNRGQPTNEDARIKRAERNISVSLLSVVSHFLGTLGIDQRSLLVDLVSLLISCLSFFIFTYYNSSFNTELVSSAPAYIHENFADIVKHDVKPLFATGTNTYEGLKYADEGTPERKLWNWAVAKYGEETLFANRNFRQLAHLMVEAYHGKVVYFTGSTTAGILKSLFCQFASRSWQRLMGILGTYTNVAVDMVKNDDWQVYTRSSESAKRDIKTMIISKKLQDSELFPLIKYIYSLSFEGGLIQAELRSLNSMNILTDPGIADLIGPPVQSRSEMRYRCINNNVLVPKLPEIDRLMPSYFFIGFKVLVTVLCTALFVLLCENIYHRVKRRNQHFE